MIEDRGVAGVQNSEPKQILVRGARSGRHIKYDMAAELKASGETKRILLLCDYLFSDAAMLAEKEGWFDMRKKKI